MLVLSRKRGEKLVIGNGITVTVVEVVGNRVRLGIEAPDDVRILRGELAWWQDDQVDPDLPNVPTDHLALAAC
jgi:carbon storage regulator